MTKIIGITGIIGTGKSIAAKYIAEKYNYELVDVDAIGHDLLEKDSAIKAAVEERFGTSNRVELAEIVFNDKNSLLDLDDLLHPKMVERINAIVNDDHAQHQSVIIDAALLYDMGLNVLCDKVICLKSSEEKIKERLLAKGLNEQQIESRLNNAPFIPEEDTVVIENDGETNNLYVNIDKFFDSNS